MTLKLPRTIRLDPSDTFVFDHAAEPGEWAVTGSFLFWDQDASVLTGKARAAFRAGFVGAKSLGFSTLVVVTDASEVERDEAVAMLAQHIVDQLGAPNLESALAAAREEIEFAASLCNHDIGTIVAMHRTLEDGAIKEQFRTLRPKPEGSGADRLHAHARAFTIIEIEDDSEEHVDLMTLSGGEPR